MVKIEIDLRKIRQPAIPVDSFVMKSLVGDLDALGVRAPKDGRADITIADGVGPLLPILVVGISSFIGFRALPVAPVVRRGLRLPDFVNSRRGHREGGEQEEEGEFNHGGHNRAPGQAGGRATEGWPRRGETSGSERVKGHGAREEFLHDFL